jgi:4'-phosphopantetheinyl transferase EntD
VIERLVGDAVVSVDTRNDVLDGSLFPEEEAVVADAVEKRRREFTAARVCAHRALERLGVPPAPVLPGVRGEPRWPLGVVGSITHCTGYRGVVLGRSGEVDSIGIDAEPNEPLKPGILVEVSLPAERRWIAELAGTVPGICWDRLLFSAKESVYKAWFPLARRPLGFDEALIAFSCDGDSASGSFTAELLVPGPRVRSVELRQFSGRWMVSDGIAMTAIVVVGRPNRPGAARPGEWAAFAGRV